MKRNLYVENRLVRAGVVNYYFNKLTGKEIKLLQGALDRVVKVYPDLLEDQDGQELFNWFARTVIIRWTQLAPDTSFKKALDWHVRNIIKRAG